MQNQIKLFQFYNQSFEINLPSQNNLYKLIDKGANKHSKSIFEKIPCIEIERKQ